VTVYDLGRDPGAIVTFAIDGIDSVQVKAALAQKRINVSASGPNSTLLDFTARQLPVVVRAAPHYYNSEDEVEAAVAAVKALL
jgi:selenocysteine lyase/cysteine desulfurase